MSRADLLRYWPREEDVTACLKTEAEASREAVCFAVHQPMRFERRFVGAGPSSVLDECDEHELLRAFLTESLSEGRVILLIDGSSGVGKSHVVRWLDAQLGRLADAERRVIIRIPKGTSLKSVLGILLDRLHGPVYEEHRQKLAKAQQELDSREAAGLLCEMLAQTLEAMAEDASQRLRANPTDLRAREQQAYCSSSMLPTLLRNQRLRDQHFVNSPDGGAGIVKRLVEQLTESRGPGLEDNRQHVFRPDDLVFDGRIRREELGRDEVRVLGQLDRPDRREVAARILNEALDGAKERLLGFGGSTVMELFAAVRRELLREGKELVLLVEDFAVLSGLQRQLLQVVIQEAVREGRQVLCTMRTALAYTTGYPIPETVLTRAHVVYRIPDQPWTEEEILDRIDQLVGAYVNAARLGETELDRAYRERTADPENPRAWIPRFTAKVEPDTRQTLEAFGTSDGYELFPFNRAAIHELARDGCVHNNQLVYNPRFVIQNVLNKVLSHRDLFANGAFPPPTFGRPRLPMRVAEAVRQRVPGPFLDRYLRFLAYWGGCPNDPADAAAVEPRVFEAFGLETLSWARGTPPQPVHKPTAPPREPVSEPTVSPRTVPLLAKWEKCLEEWRQGATLGQEEARQLRKWIAEALKGAIDWDWDLFRPRKDEWLDRWFSWVYIPRALGNEGRNADQAMAAVCRDEDLDDEKASARVASALMALIRFHGVYKGSWDYEGADEDLPRYAAFVDALVARARPFVRSRYFYYGETPWDPVPALVQGLLIGARGLGIEGADRDADHAALLNALFVTAPEGMPVNGTGSTEQDPTGWTSFAAQLARCRAANAAEARNRWAWNDHLLNLVGARQGGAERVYAVDLLHLKPAIEETLKIWTFTETPQHQAGYPEYDEFRRHYVELKKLSSAVGKARKRLLDWRSQMLAWLGDDADKDALVQELKKTIEEAKAAGLTGGLNTKQLGELIETFRNSKVKAALDDVAAIEDSTTQGRVLAVLGRGYEPVVRVCETLRASCEEFLKSVEDELRGEVMRFGADPAGEAMDDLEAELERLTSLLKGIRS